MRMPVSAKLQLQSFLDRGKQAHGVMAVTRA
jgi:hypothetical protein